jgi:hypothetical protein
MLEAEHISEIIAASQAKVVICLGASAYTDIWEKVTAAVENIESVDTLLCVNIEGFANSDATEYSHHRIQLLDTNQ